MDVFLFRKKVQEAKEAKQQDEAATRCGARQVTTLPSHLFFQHNTALGPPYHVLLDTNFINKSFQNKLDILPALMDCLYAKCQHRSYFIQRLILYLVVGIPYVTDCVMAELEKLGPKYRLALRLAKDATVMQRLPCAHPGTYADDCLVERVQTHRCYIVATNDKDLKGRLRKIPGVPILYVGNHKYAIERLPEAPTSFV
jgi:U3 small nucleolar RNA-associated protein 24